MRVHSLYVYPVKSLAGIAVDFFELDDFGPVADRRWMLVDEQGCFVTQRKYPQLARVSTRLAGRAGVTVTIPDTGSFTLATSGEPVQVQVWKDQVQAIQGTADANAAISRFCGLPLRFVYMPDDSFRRIDPAYVRENRRVGFADGFPLLVTSLASLEELNSRLDQPVPMRRFRPNIVVEGAPAWAEDSWRSLGIGALRIHLVKRCSRCVMTTVDPETGLKDQALQPLRTLAAYRKADDGVIFGMNGVHSGTGMIRVGDAVAVTTREDC